MTTILQERGFAALPFGDFASGAVRALPGFTIDRVVLEAPAPLETGFAAVEKHLRSLGSPMTSLCGFELRIPAVLSLEDFRAFNSRYVTQLRSWGVLLENGHSPLTRTNVAPKSFGFPGPAVQAFSYVRRSEVGELSGAAFVVAGAPEMEDGASYPSQIVCRGDTSETGLAAKTAAAFAVMSRRVEALGIEWDRATRVHLYSLHPVAGLLQAAVSARLGTNPADGVIWHEAAPPVPELELEIDIRRYSREHYLPM